MSVIIQAGHLHIQSNCDWGLRGETGANGEVEYVTEISGMVCGGLEANGVSAIGADANANCDGQITTRDFQAVVALHCDGRTTSGFAVGVGNPTEDGAGEASANLRQSLRTAYAAATGLTDIDDLVNDPNVTEYYLFNSLTSATPFALIELGAIADSQGRPGSDEAYLLAHKQQVAEGVVNGVLAFLGIASAEKPPESPQNGSNTPSSPVVTPKPVEVPEVTPPPLVGPPPGLIPPETQNKQSILTNLGQAIAYTEQLQAAVLLYFQTGNEVSWDDWHNVFIQILNELHTARGLMGGE